MMKPSNNFRDYGMASLGAAVVTLLGWMLGYFLTSPFQPLVGPCASDALPPWMTVLILFLWLFGPPAAGTWVFYRTIKLADRKLADRDPPPKP